MNVFSSIENWWSKFQRSATFFQKIIFELSKLMLCIYVSYRSHTKSFNHFQRHFQFFSKNVHGFAFWEIFELKVENWQVSEIDHGDVESHIQSSYNSCSSELWCLLNLWSIFLISVPKLSLSEYATFWKQLGGLILTFCNIL